MIETPAQRDKRIKAEKTEREARAKRYAEKMGTLPATTSTPPTPADPNAPLSKLDAKKLTKQIRDHLEGAASLIVRAHEKEAWRVLGYGTWTEYVQEEFKVSRAHAYRLLDHSQACHQIGDNPPQYEAQTRPLKGLPAPAKRKAWKKAAKVADGAQPTARQVAAEVAKLKPAKAHVVGTEQNLPIIIREAKPCYICDQPIGDDDDVVILRGGDAHKRCASQELPPAAKVERPTAELYHELLYAVEEKHPGETRHETALRFICEAQRRNAEPAQEAR